MKAKMLESFAKYQNMGSGWVLSAIEELEIFITKYKPLRGKSWKPLPDVIKVKKAIINPENDDDKCFMWAVIISDNPVGRDSKRPGRINKILKKQTEKYDWSGLKFPVELKDIDIFENKNDINVNVFSWDDLKEEDKHKKVYPLRLGKGGGSKTLNLFYWDQHYSVVKNMSRLVGSQLSKNQHKKFICLRCLNAFGSEVLLEKHQELCQNPDYQLHVFPTNKDKILEFNKFERQHRVPFVVYADFEAFL